MKHAFTDDFSNRHIGISKIEEKEMLDSIGLSSMDELIDETIPKSIRRKKALKLPAALSEMELLQELKEKAKKNQTWRSFIGQGYYQSFTPPVIQRNIFENPGWYTQYTPYQAEISQGRLEALLNFQTMISDLTGLPLANASLLDEGTAAAEAMAMFYSIKNKRAKKGSETNQFFVDANIFEHNKEVILSRAKPLGIDVIFGSWKDFTFDASFFGVLLQYPNAIGEIEDYKVFCAQCSENAMYVTVISDPLALCVLEAPGNWGADAVVGNSQRFGVPMGFGGPHAAFFATKEEFKRNIPGRIIGVSKDADGRVAYRMALQTREQHIKRDKATSNICTAQALLAIMAGMYAVYHGPDGLKRIAQRVLNITSDLKGKLQSRDFEIENNYHFDTISILLNSDQKDKIKKAAEKSEINLFYKDNGVSISIDECTTDAELNQLAAIFNPANLNEKFKLKNQKTISIPSFAKRKSSYMDHSVFSSHHTETEMMRYLKRLENRDLSLVHSMIPLGSCTMKLNAAAQLMPVSWPEFGQIHPFVPSEQSLGYMDIIYDLEKYLCNITGFEACSLQPNSGAQGELTGLLLIKAYHDEKGTNHRNIVLIPSSAHGTNPASAVMAGYKVVIVKCDEKGNIDMFDMQSKIAAHQGHIAGLMITYPSTHGVFEEGVVAICDAIHEEGGLVYLDGANLNAQIGLTDPATIGADVCHLNLHKTFAIPHGGGGPGMGPVCVNEKLAPFLPSHKYADCGGVNPIHSVSSAAYGSASILIISYAYIRLLGAKGLIKSTEIAILSANYLKSQLQNDYPVVYVGSKNRCAHEFILDLRQYKSANITAEDVAKRLIDYGFHAPTLSFPVPGTVMIEPTESESKAELDRFIEAMKGIKNEIIEIVNGEADANDNVLANAPHSLIRVTANDWKHSYSREKAAFPMGENQKSNKFWPAISRVDNAFGDRNLYCTCPPIEAYEEVLS